MSVIDEQRQVAGVPASIFLDEYNVSQLHQEQQLLHQHLQTTVGFDSVMDGINQKDRKFQWNLDMDQLLHNGVAIHGDRDSSWPLVSEFIYEHCLQSTVMNNPRDYNVDFPTPLECQRRWRNVPAVAGNGGHSTTKHGKDSNNKTSYCPWTDEEQSQLMQMVDEALHSDSNFDYTKVVTIGNDKVRTISWTNIAKAMNRTPEDISHAWSKIRLSKFKRGAYSPEEDRLIVTRVREWYSQPEEIRPKSGLWVALEKELNREDKRISERWRSILSKRVTFTVQESVSSHSLLSEPISKAKRQRKDHHAHNVFDNQNQHHFHHITNISSSGAGSFPPHASISVETFGMVPGDSVKGKDHIDMNMIALVDDSNFEFEVMEKPESVRWNDDMDRLLREGVTVHGTNWSKIAEYINDNTEVPKGRVDDAKCRGRHYRNLRKEVQFR